MKDQYVLFVAFLLCTCGMTSEAYGWGGIPIPILWGHGETMTEMGELPLEVSQDIEAELGPSVTVAFVHSYFHVFFLDVWTWRGRHVLHCGDGYREIDDVTWREMIGSSPTAKYGKPIRYRLPRIIALLLAALMTYSWLHKTEEEKLQALFKNKKYQRSLEMCVGTKDFENQQGSQLVISIDEERFTAAKDALIANGIKPQLAETNLRQMAEVVIKEHLATVDKQLDVAFDLDKQGEWQRSAEIYEHIISVLPAEHELAIYAQERLGALRKNKPAATATEQTDEPEPE